MITECWTTQSNHRDTVLSIILYLVKCMAQKSNPMTAVYEGEYNYLISSTGSHVHVHMYMFD